MELSALGEFGLIARIRRGANQRWPQVLLGIGGDASAFRPSEGSILLATTDLLLEGIHFFREIPSFHVLGKKCLAVNISDIAAMGGTPRLALISLALASRERVESMDALYAGMEEEAEEYGVTIAGGDTSLSPGPLMVNVVLLGEAKEGCWVQRAGARVGDALMVTGALGASAAGLEVIRAGLEVDAGIRARPFSSWSRFRGLDASRRQAIEAALNAHFLPIPRVREGQRLAGEGWAHAMIDLSDGLASDLGHICRESRVGARVYEEAIPISPSAQAVAEELDKDPLRLAIQGGEDYELLFSTSHPEQVAEAFLEAGLAPVNRIGEILAESEGVNLVSRKGDLTPLGGGFDHFLNRGNDDPMAP
jgi:thiamine-monophosphate kinase